MNSSAEPLRLVIDTDTASDDAVALILAALEPGVRIEAVTVVAGNVSVQQGVWNALYTLELLGRTDVPVYQGRSGPAMRALDTAQHVHGTDGMGDVGLPLPTGSPEAADAVTRLVELANQHPGRLTLVTLGPLTNVAAALEIDPDLLGKYRRVVLMAGAADGVGNVAPVGEFNVWADPEAARRVVGSGGDLTFVGWDVSRRYAVLNEREQDRLVRVGTPLAAYMHGINRSVNDWAHTRTGLAGYDLPDPIAMAVALRPHLVTRSAPAHVAVATEEPARGMLVVDRRFAPLPSNATIVWEVDETGFKELLFERAATPLPDDARLPAGLLPPTGGTT